MHMYTAKSLSDDYKAIHDLAPSYILNPINGTSFQTCQGSYQFRDFLLFLSLANGPLL